MLGHSNSVCPFTDISCVNVIHHQMRNIFIWKVSVYPSGNLELKRRFFPGRWRENICMSGFKKNLFF